MYTRPDEARSDLFLSGAVFVFGWTVVNILVAVLRLDQIPGVQVGLLLGLPVILTVLTPTLLIRYRKQTWAQHGLTGFDASVPPALLATGVLLVGGVAANLLGGYPLGSSMPLLQLPTAPLEVIAGTLQTTGALVLAGYGIVKARDAFGGNPITLSQGILRVGRILLIIGGVALAFMIIGDLFSGRNDLDGLVLVSYLVRPVAVAAAVWLVLRRLGGNATITMPILVTPAVLMGLSQFGIRLGGAFLAGLYRGAIYAGLGLLLAIIAERTGRISGAVVLGLGVALLAGLA